MKKVLPVLFLLAVIGLIAFLIIRGMDRKVAVKETLDSSEQIFYTVSTAILDHKREIQFNSTVAPEEASLNLLFPYVLEKDPYTGAEFHHYTYSYSVEGGLYRVKMKVSTPSSWASFWTKLRVKQIASSIEKKCTTDEEKVKAVHDYLVTLTKYSYIKGGAYSCLYFQSSACNGYAYSFYLIMKEMDIPVTVEFGGNHAWNKVMVDGKWYNMDCTWDDQGGKVLYDNYLKCDTDFPEHEHAGADAVESIPPRGRSAKQNYRLVPPFPLFQKLAIVLAIAFVFLAFRLYIKHLNRKELRDIQAKLKREEEAQKIFEEQIAKKREAFAEENHNIW